MLKYETNLGWKVYRVTAGMPQGSVLDPLLWNVMYNAFLDLDLLGDAHMMGYADNAAIVLKANTAEVLEIIANDSLRRGSRWLENRGLEMTGHKTEALLVTDRRIFEEPKL